MEKLYREITNHLVKSGERLIERELTDLILPNYPDHKIFAEEEHDNFESTDAPSPEGRQFIEGGKDILIKLLELTNL